MPPKNIKDTRKLGIISGGGILPTMIRDACIKEGRPYFILALEGQAAPDLYLSHPHAIVRLGAVGQGVAHLKEAEAHDVVLAGTVKRPGWTHLRPDKMGLAWLMRIGKAALGDDGILSGVIAGFESEGMNVLSVQDVLPKALASAGVMGKIAPTSKDKDDISRGIVIAKALGRVDVGQAVIVENGLALSVEGIEGTEKLLERTQSLKRESHAGVLIKALKPQQEMRVDLPSIGPETIAQVKKCGLNGIAIESEGALILDCEVTVRAADKAGVFLMGFEAKDYVK